MQEAPLQRRCDVKVHLVHFYIIFFALVNDLEKEEGAVDEFTRKMCACKMCKIQEARTKAQKLK